MISPDHDIASTKNIFEGEKLNDAFLVVVQSAPKFVEMTSEFWNIVSNVSQFLV